MTAKAEKYIYWGAGIVAVIGISYWIWKSKQEDTSSAEGGGRKQCQQNPPPVPVLPGCTKWELRYNPCHWECMKQK
jgi:hypothetical protein